MNKKAILLSILMAPIFFVILFVYLGRDRHSVDTIVSGKIDTSISAQEGLDQGLDHRVLPDEPEEISEKSTERSPLGRLPKTVSEIPSTEPEDSATESFEILPNQQVQAKSAMKRSVPKVPSVVLPPEKMSMVKLCGGPAISRCGDVDFTHGDFALLIINILGLERAESFEEAFEILESLQIGPVGGWATANAQKLVTPRAMEEVRCSISLAFEAGLIRVGPTIVAAAVNRFCEEFVVSQRAVEDSGIVKDRPDISYGTGYRGGTNGGVVSSPY